MKSRKDYFSFHDLKDLVMIYGHYDKEHPENNYEWDDAYITLWCPELGRHFKMSFTGSTRPDREHTILDDKGRGEINFVLSPVGKPDYSYMTKRARLGAWMTEVKWPWGHYIFPIWLVDMIRGYKLIKNNILGCRDIR